MKYLNLKYDLGINHQLVVKKNILVGETGIKYESNAYEVPGLPVN